MSVFVYSRSLVPSHFFRRKVLAWRCSVCWKIFCRTLDEVERESGNSPPIYIESEFRLHNCELVLVARQEQRAAQSPVRVLIEFWDATRSDRQRGER